MLCRILVSSWFAPLLSSFFALALAAGLAAAPPPTDSGDGAPYEAPPEAPPYEAPPQTPPPPTWLPTPELPILKLVPIQYCLVDDGRINAAAGAAPGKSPVTNPGPPAGRFLPGPLLTGLIVKDVVFSQASIFFVPVGPILVVDDPHPNRAPWTEGGELGDVADPGGGYRYGRSDVPYPPFESSFQPSPSLVAIAPARGPSAVQPNGAAQLRAIENACELHPNRRPGVILEVLIRRFVAAIDNDGDGRIDEDTALEGIRVGDFDGDGADGEDWVESASILGLALTPPCSFEPARLPLTATTIDPDAFPSLIAFGIVQAHENAHALCLGHVGIPGNLMVPTAPPFGFEINFIQRLLLLIQSQHLAATRDKSLLTGETIVRSGPITARAVDPIGDAPGPAVDITGVAIARRADGSLGLMLELAGVLPKGLETVRYRFGVDVDADPSSGQPYRAADGATLDGADLRVIVDIGTVSGKPVFEAHLERAAATGWSADEAKLGLRLEPIILERESEPDVWLSHALLAVVPASALPAPLAEGYRLLADAASGKAYDVIPTLTGSVAPKRYDDAATIDLEPLVVGVGEPYKVQGRNYRPGAEVPIYTGQQLAATATVGKDGRFDVELIAAPRTDSAWIVPPGNAMMPVMAFDLDGGGDAMLLTITRDRPNERRPSPRRQ